jgi:hypothetical protein
LYHFASKITVSLNLQVLSQDALQKKNAGFTARFGKPACVQGKVVEATIAEEMSKEGMR